MQTIFIIAILALGFLVTFQIAKASEYVAILRGEEESRKQANRINAFLLLIFLIVGLIGVYYCNEKLKGRILGEAASDHGDKIDLMLYITIAITGIVFVITQVLLFWFAYKYQEKENRKAYYFVHSTKLELIWTVIPAIVLTVLVGFGIYYWIIITGPAPANAAQIEITGYQFGWEFRYPGADKTLGKKYFKNIDPGKNNPLGQIWEDSANMDDVYVPGSEPMHLVVNKPVKLIINAKDVLHDVGLVHFRMKMDAVPGTPTTMWFTPKFTTKQMQEKYGPDFVYEISCDQMCGKGHTGMRGTIVVDTQEEYDAWWAGKMSKPQYYVAFPEKAPDYKPAIDTAAAKVTAAVVPAGPMATSK